MVWPGLAGGPVFTGCLRADNTNCPLFGLKLPLDHGSLDGCTLDVPILTVVCIFFSVDDCGNLTKITVAGDHEKMTAVSN